MRNSALPAGEFTEGITLSGSPAGSATEMRGEAALQRHVISIRKRENEV